MRSLGRFILVLAGLSGLCHGLTPDQWREDLQALAARLPASNPNFFAHASRTEFNAAIDRLGTEIPDLNDGQIVTRMAQLVAMAADGHTSLPLTQPAAKFHAFPLTLYWFQEGIYATGAVSSTALPALGKRLVRIENTPVEEAAALVAIAISHDTDQWVRFTAPTYLVLPEVLVSVGIIPDVNMARFTFDNGDGTEVTLELTPIALGSPTAFKTPHPAFPNQPLYQRNSNFYYWAQYLPESSALYIKYNKCAEDPTLPFGVFVAGVLDLIDTKPVLRIIFDLRNNEGGNTAVITPLLNGLQVRRQRGILAPGVVAVAIIGRETFSSGVLNAYDLKNNGTTLVGEVAGWNPNGYGEVGSFVLPNSSLTISYSKRKFNLPGVGSVLAPDVPVEVKWSDYATERDLLLEAALNVQP